MEKKDDISKCLKYIKVLKPIFDSCGLDWQAVISEDYCDMDSTLNKLGVLLAENQTPRRRITDLKNLICLMKRPYLALLCRNSQAQAMCRINICLVRLMRSFRVIFTANIRRILSSSLNRSTLPQVMQA